MFFSLYVCQYNPIQEHLRLFEALYNIDECLELMNGLKDDRKANQIAYRDRYSNNQ